MVEEQVFFFYLCSFLHVLRYQVKSSSQVQGVIQLNSMEGVSKDSYNISMFIWGGWIRGAYSSRLFIYCNFF